MNEYLVPFMSELQGFLGIFFCWNSLLFSLSTTSINLSDKLVIVVCGLVMES